MTFDMVKIHGVGNPIDLVEIPQIPIQVRIVNNASNIAFEMTMVDRVEADQCDEESPVCFERQVPEEVSSI
jgi:hypothetical protein